jgi:aspartyl protease family protein
LLATVIVAFLTARALAGDAWVEALLPGMAVLQIDGARVMLRVGEAHGDLRLIAADSRSATVEVGGERRRLEVSERISGSFTRPERPSVVVRRDSQLQYRTTAELNGVRMPVIVDTGANIVAMNAAHAKSLGIDPDAGIAAQVQTASAVLPARRVMLDSVSVGGIRVNAVAATIIDGSQPATVLLGMSFLQHVEMREVDGILTLRGRW